MKKKAAYIHFSILTLGFNFLQTPVALAQKVPLPRPSKFQVELEGYASTSPDTPFWLRANQFGTVPLQSPAVVGGFRYTLDYRKKLATEHDSLIPKARLFSWGVGVNPLISVGAKSTIIIPEAYVKLKLGPMELYSGRWRQIIGVGDSLLSSGFMIMSGNAIPIPKVQLATQGYVPLQFLRSILSINAGFAHGWFLNSYIQNSYLHQKYLYLRVGKPSATLKIYMGLNHQVQWGGHADYLLESPFAINGRLPSSLEDYVNVVLARRTKEYDTTRHTSFDNLYRIGNQVGSQDAGVEITTRKARILAYYQHSFEDVSGVFFQNVPDGLYGLSWQRRHPRNPETFSVTRVVAEFLTTLDQSGAIFWQPNSYFQGNDNYFNHGQFKQGWSYRGRSLGTPFIAPYTELASDVPVSDFFTDNRVQMYYLGAAGNLTQKVHWTTRLAFSRHLGTYNQPFEQTLNQFSFLLGAQSEPFKSQKTTIKVALALDQGQVLPRAVGVSLGAMYSLD